MLFSTNTYASAINVNIDDKDGLFQVYGKDGLLLTSKYVGWLKGWKWDGPKISKIRTTIEEKEYLIDFRQQGVKSKVKIKNLKSKIKYSYQHIFSKNLENTIGGGVEFNLDLASQIRKYGAKEPTILPNKKGWSWEFESNRFLEIKFSPSIVNVYFERGNKSHIRALFFGDKLTVGKREMSMQVSITSGSSIMDFQYASNTNKFRSWNKRPISPINSFIDLSSLNDKPAGQHGFVKAVGSELKFSDNTPARFFGANVQAYSLFINDKLKIKKHAQRISQLGFNLVRLHHHDSPWVNPSLITKGNTTQEINAKALDAYFWWIKCLRDEGVYVWVDLQVERPWRKGDEIPGWETDLECKAKKGMNVAKGFIYLNKRMQELTKKFNKELLTRINPYTQLAIKDDPAIMGIMITNENDLTHHFGNAFLKDKNHPYHQNLFDKEVEMFADKFNFRASKVRETWKPGASKYLLNDLEAKFNQDMIKHLREIGVKVPITTTSLWGRNSSLFSLPSLTVGDMVDAHGYAGSGVFKKGLLRKNPNFKSNFLHSLGQGQVAGKPFTITEYNVGERSDKTRAYIPAISVASMAAFQGWDAIMLYGYSQDGLKGGRASPWSSYTHPAIMGVIPAMALLYRQGHVVQARKTVVLAPANDDIFTENISAKTSAAIRTTLEQHRMVVAMPKTKILPWLLPSTLPKHAQVINDFNKSLLPASQNYIESDTGEIRRNWEKGIMTVNTPKSQLAMGSIGEQNIQLADVAIKSKTSEAAIIFTSLDNKPIKNSESILLSAVAKVDKVKVKWKSSYVSEPVNASLTLASIYNDLHLIPLHTDGREGETRPIIKVSGGKYSFSLSGKDNTHWYLIKRIPNKQVSN